jgi:hypothetical protein
MKTFLSILLVDNDPTKSIISLLIGLGIVIVVFIVLRDLTLWYYKINDRIRLQEELNANIKELVRLQGGTPVTIEPKKSVLMEQESN